eukprot:3426340-Pleurochrysis_carterae.AAC.1
MKEETDATEWQRRRVVKRTGGEAASRASDFTLLTFSEHSEPLRGPRLAPPFSAIWPAEVGRAACTPLATNRQLDWLDCFSLYLPELRAIRLNKTLSPTYCYTQEPIPDFSSKFSPRLYLERSKSTCWMQTLTKYEIAALWDCRIQINASTCNLPKLLLEWEQSTQLTLGGQQKPAAVVAKSPKSDFVEKDESSIPAPA